LVVVVKAVRVQVMVQLVAMVVFQELQKQLQEIF
tara:strand:- start:432 stop:533 length:102 start_codon:yes stop_codon:yes gene_type:complete